MRAVPTSPNIYGTNPDPIAGGLLDNALGQVMINSTPLWFAKNVAIHETNESQFYVAGYYDSSTGVGCGQPPQTPGMPYFGVPGGYGIVQHDPPNTADEPWSWRSTLSAWTGLVQSLAGQETNGSGQQAYQFWIRQVTQWQGYNATNGNDRPWSYDVSQDTYPNCRFLPPSLTAPTTRNTGQAGTYWYGDAILMKQIAGAPQNWVSWNNSDPVHPYWSFVKGNSVSPDIVLGFCSCGSGKSSCKPGY